ncbi:MAG: FAD-dependent oxidoreductase [Peptococcaceae bacterium]|nr:FAD-dependent oxidoreductase [Peptococcaceae bacterium]
MKRTLILGGGSGGVVAANILKKLVGRTMRVTLVDRETNHYFASSYPRVIIGERQPNQIIKGLKSLENKRIEFRHCEVKELDLAGHRVITDKHDLEYDYLIISLGVEYNLDTVPGFRENAFNVYDFQDVVKVNQKLREFSAGKIVLFISSLPYKCPPGPYEIMLLIDQYFRQRGIRHKVKLTVVTPEKSPESLAGPKISQKLRKMLLDRGIELIAEAKILAVEKNALILDHDAKIPADLLLGIASHWTPQAIRNTDLVDKNGFINVDPFTLETKYKGVYAIGDAAAIKTPVMGVYAPKAGIFAHMQAKVVARNIASMAQGSKPESYYDGKGFCIINTGFGQGCYTSVHYYKKPPTFTFIRPTKAAYLLKVGFEKYWLNCWF